MKYKVDIHYQVDTFTKWQESDGKTIEEKKTKKVLYQSEVVAPNQQIAAMVAMFNLETREQQSKPLIIEITVTAIDEVLKVTSAS